jgi:transcriptional regulator with XRE-family HTH domain
VTEMWTADEAKQSVERAKRSLADAGQEIVAQVANRAWEPLGYPDWDAMRQAEYGGIAVIVPRADRPELVAALRREGLSQQQTADTLGVTQRQISSDEKGIRSSSNTLPPTRTDATGRERPTTYQRPIEGTVLEPSPAVTDFLDSDPDLQRARYLHEFMKAITRSDDFMEFDPEKLAEMADPTLTRTVDDYLIRVRNFSDRFHHARPALRAVNGEKS